MAYDEALAQRIREVASARPGVSERRMFGGLAFMVNGNMATGVMSDGGLLVRLPAEEAEAAWREPGVGPFGRDGAKPMTGFVRVEVDDDTDIAGWIDAGLDHASSLPPK